MYSRNKIFAFLFKLLVFTGLFPAVLFAQQKDSLQTKDLEGVTIYNKRNVQTETHSASTQIMDSLHLQSIPSLQLSDVIKHFSGVIVKDYGGLGGLKTVSVRSLGANHTAVAYDGLTVTDYQSGQINIGRFSLDNTDCITLYVGEGTDIFRPARSFASASLLQLNTRKAVFKDNKPWNVNVSFKTGSFHLYQPTVLLENKIGKRIITSFYGEYIYNKGNYPFSIQNADSSMRFRRENADMQCYRTEANVYLQINSKQELNAKVFYYYAKQGLPGAVVFYSLPSRQRLWDENLFAQLHYQYNIKEKLRFQSNAKWNYSYLRYLDSDYLNMEGKLDNKYWQREFYLSNAVLYEVVPKLSLSLSNDLFLNNMHTSMEDFPLPYRYSSLTAASTLFRLKKFSLSATLLHSYIYDMIKGEDKGTVRHRLNPSFHISYQPIEKKSFYIEAFYKNIFRMPTFNDLYYRLVGNTNLKPERTHQFDVGVKWVEYINVLLPYVSLSADVYHNIVNDKIVAIPNKNLFVWSMINLGKVSVTGMNLQAMVEMKYHRHIQTDYMINYTYQYVVDISDEKAKNYKHQIPYTPKHSVSAVVALKTKWINVSYSLLYVGERYILGQNTDDNALLPYTDQGIAVYRGFTIKETQLTLRAEMLNMCNKQYEVVKNYPMPGRHFQIRVSFKF